MHLMECERASWFYCLLSTLQGTEAHLPHAAGQKNDVMSPRNLWERRVPTSYSGQFRMFGTFMLNNVNAGGSAIFIRKDLLPDHAFVSHVITYQGRDHIVTRRSGESVLVIVNVHFEPDLALRDLRERLHRISLHWPRYPEALGVIIGEFNICEPEEGRFNVRNQTFAEGDAWKTALSDPFFRMLLKLRNQFFTRKDTVADGTLRTLSRIYRAFINVPVAEARDFSLLFSCF